MINNTYSLLNTNWLIEPSMKNTLLPQLQNVLDGKLVEGTINYTVAQTAKATIAGTKTNTTPTSSDQYVAVIPIKGGIFKYDQFCGPRGTQTLGVQIQAYDRDINCVGIILDIDSGGGQVSGTAELYDIIKATTTRIETYSNGMLCSAAYYIASATDKITINKRADIIGSIGVLTYFVDLTGYYENLGAKVVEEYATKSTGKNKPMRELLNGNPELWIKTVLDPIAEEFHKDVKVQRKDIKEDVFTGATYTPKESLDMGLVDALGTLKKVVDSMLTENKSKENKSSMSNKNALTALTAVLAVEALAANDKGTYLNEEQLGTINTTLEEKDATIKANGITIAEFETKVTALATAAKETGANLSNIFTTLGVTQTGDAKADNDVLLAKIAELNGKPGNAHTGAKGNENPPTDEQKSIVDADASHNQLANSIFD